MTGVELGRREHVANRRGARHTHPGHPGLRTELVISVVVAAWAMVLLCGYIAGAVP